jgi:hypothetical protein
MDTKRWLQGNSRRAKNLRKDEASNLINIAVLHCLALEIMTEATPDCAADLYLRISYIVLDIWHGDINMDAVVTVKSGYIYQRHRFHATSEPWKEPRQRAIACEISKVISRKSHLS